MAFLALTGPISGPAAGPRTGPGWCGRRRAARSVVAISVLSAALALFALVAAALSGAQAVQPISHRATYILKLKAAKSSSGIADARGALYYELAEACDGWTITQRLRLRILNNRGGELDSKTSFTSWESKDGLGYRFNSRTVRNGKLTEDVRGRARLGSGQQGGEVVFTSPKEKRLKLPPGTLFPMAHMILVLERAEAGDGHVWRIVFDGATEDGAYEVSAVVGAPVDPRPGVTLLPAARGRAWPIKLAYYPHGGRAPEPEYELFMRITDKAVAREFVLDYDAFTLDAVLDLIEPLEKIEC